MRMKNNKRQCYSGCALPPAEFFILLLVKLIDGKNLQDSDYTTRSI